MSAEQLPHYVKVEAQFDSSGTELEPKVTLECPWQYGECHFYPNCSCEYFDHQHFAENGPGHEREHHAECWLQGWFEAGQHSYTGDDFDDMGDYCLPAGMNRSGQISTLFCEEYVEWEFVK